MLGVRLICVGKMRERFYIDAFSEYSKRLSAYCRFDCVEIAEQRLPEKPSAAEIESALNREGQEIEKQIPPDAYVVALCVEGKQVPSEAMAELINYFRECDEKTMILFFGDHQPEIGDDFWEYCFGKDLDDLSFEEQQMEYETCFFVWANYDIPEAEGLTMSANYLSSYLLSLTGLEMTPYQEFLFRQREEIPAMNAYGYLDAEGGAHQWDTESVGAEAGKAIGDYKCLIYDELTGGASRDGTFYGIS